MYSRQGGTLLKRLALLIFRILGDKRKNFVHLSTEI